MRPVRWRKGALAFVFLLIAFMLLLSIKNREKTNTIVNEASETTDRTAPTRSPPLPTPRRQNNAQETTERQIRKETEKPEENIRDKALRINRMERVLNENRFPNHLTSPEAIILVVQVHNRANYFKYLIESLKAIREVDRVLVIISHDLYSEEMNSLVKSIDFCRVVQVFYPYSMQFYPDQFPAQDPLDCPRDINRAQAMQRRCKNAEHPDQYGHYREAKVTMTKHHWWWKISHVFDGMKLTKDFTGHVVFLEEDHYASPDLVYMLNKMISMKPSACPSCDFIGLGIYDKLNDFKSLGSAIHVQAWVSGKHNMGFAMNRETWNRLKSCSKIFCEFDDYNWDWTLQSLGKRCLNRPLSVVVVKTPKVFHIGQCGVHHTKSAQCDAKPTVDHFRDVIQKNLENLFPKEINLIGSSYPPASFAIMTNTGYGGWGDMRDRQLCLSYTEQNPEAILSQLGGYLKHL